MGVLNEVELMTRKPTYCPSKLSRVALLQVALCTASLPLLVASGCKSSGGSSVTGKGGSLSRLAIRGDYLFALGGTELHVFDISAGDSPRRIGETEVAFPNPETIFIDEGGRLYVGCRDGLAIYDIAQPTAPRLLGKRRHLNSCDPVVVRGTTAFVTLRTDGVCPHGLDELQVYDVSNPVEPKLIVTYPLTNPHGLGVDGDLLFVTDGPAGLRIYNSKDPLNLRLMESHPEIIGIDVIPNNGTLIVSATDGIYQYDYRRLPLARLSRIPVIPMPWLRLYW